MTTEQWPRQWMVVPSDIVIQSALEVRTIADSTTSYTKSKEIEITFPGTYRIRFTLTNTTGGVAGRVYKNGEAIGSERLQEVTANQTLEYVENIPGWERGDLCQLYVKRTGGSGNTCRGFAIAGEVALVQVPPPQGSVITDTNV